ncbi:fungal-specific transcription factor domain-domain-containing protein, partial [Coniella lustricola]
MPAHSPPSPQMHPAKRHRACSPEHDSPVSVSNSNSNINNATPAGPSPATSELQDRGPAPGSAPTPAQRVGQSSSFRNVSACNRCRLRKNRCDQKLPSCASCEKASVACVGYDPITKKEIPRSYVFYLETRVQQLETLLRASNIAFPPADDLEHCSRAGPDSIAAPSPADAAAPSAPADQHDGSIRGGASVLSAGAGAGASAHPSSNNNNNNNSEPSDEAKLHRLVAHADITHGKEGAANPRYLGAASGVSFARVVFAAVQSSVSENKSTSDKAGVRPSKPPGGGGGGGGLGSVGATTMRDSFFGLHTKPSIHPARFPDKDVGTALVNLYFEHANPQIPILHRVDFHRLLEQAYDPAHPQRGPRELYMLNMVFAIGSGIIMGATTATTRAEPHNSAAKPGEGRMSPAQAQPEEYHASAMVHLEACLNNSSGGLDELQAVLLLANFALLRPVPPGLWYIVGVAVRLAVDLGLHYEDGKDVDAGLRDHPPPDDLRRERGRRECIRDLRRRLWWSTYSLDRLVSICVGRPVGISDQVITTEFPSVLDDARITPLGLHEPAPDSAAAAAPSYKLVAHHYFRLRLLQSEILQVLQYQQAQSARASGQNVHNAYMHTRLPSPFLSRFASFRAWRIDIDKRLYAWKMTAPTKQHTGVGFSTEFLDLNYWQAIVMLYRQSLSVPAMFEGEYNTSMDIKTAPTTAATAAILTTAGREDDEDRVYLKVAEAGQKIMRLYRQLHLAGVLNYTYLATHHIFMAAISYLYAIWHSPIVRSRL